MAAKRIHSNSNGLFIARHNWTGSRFLALVYLVCLCLCGSTVAEENTNSNPATNNATSSQPGFLIQTYEVKGEPALSNESLSPTLGRHTGTNVGLHEIVKTASEVMAVYRAQGYTNICVAISQSRITNGVVTLNVFRGGISQILVSGTRYPISEEETAAALQPTGATNAAQAAATNAGPRFVVRAYEIHGDTLLTTATLMGILTNYVGTNIGIAEISKAGSELQLEYRRRGYPTVNVTIPPQQITNGIVRFRVFEGRLSEITVNKNRYFSSNNVMRALPSLRTNIILNGQVFQAELDRANANQDRQISPQLEPGEAINATALRLEVQDRPPLHAKVELNNYNTPQTPDLRLNTSAVYNNLWQHEHSLGLQYSFSPEEYKSGDQWNFYDRPLVANYSGFYRLPLANPGSVAAQVAAGPGPFGYDEATRKFRLPAALGVPELNVYASRSTIDSGVQTTLDKVLFSTNNSSLARQDQQQDITINNDLGGRLSIPAPGNQNFQSGFSGGLDYKSYDLSTYKTNIFTFTSIVIDDTSNPGHPVTNVNVSVVRSPVPESGVTHSHIDYLPLALRYDASLRDSLGVTTFGLGLSGNVWFSGSVDNIQDLTGSTESTGYWFILTPSLARDIAFPKNWTLSLRTDGQWTTQPLISNEQYGIGGVNSVRGYHEGEVFGDTGWRVSIEEKTPVQVIGRLYGKQMLTLRASAYMDFADTYLLDPQGRPGSTSLWGTGFGAVVALGSHWEARLLFSWPLESVTAFTPGQPTATTVPAFQPRFNFSLTGQF